jgi:hypothetical protein
MLWHSTVGKSSGVNASKPCKQKIILPCLHGFRTHDFQNAHTLPTEVHGYVQYMTVDCTVRFQRKHYEYIKQI